MEPEYPPIGTCSRLLAHIPAGYRQEGNVCSPSDIVEWPGNELRGLPKPPPPNPVYQKRIFTGAKHTPRTPPATEPPRPLATLHPSRRAQQNDTENTGRDRVPHAASSADSAAFFHLQQSDQSDMDTEEHSAAQSVRKRKRPGPVPKLEHMILQDFQLGGYFDMQMEEAAAKLGVGRTVLTRRMRQLGIQRWPYRRRASIRSLILKTRLYLSWQSAAQHPAEQALPTENIVDMLQREMDPCKDGKNALLEDAIMRYRQSFFKQEHIVKRTGVATGDYHN